MKEYIELELPESVDVFEEVVRLRKVKNIKDATVVTGTIIRISYNSKKIKKEEVIKLTKGKLTECC